MEAPVYNAQGKKSGSIQLPEGVFGVEWNNSLMHQVVVAMQSNARPPVAHVKTRGEVRGGGKKPWQQKGTGRARHGSIRSPIWRGGGITHGPRNEKNYMRAIPKKMRAKALFMALSRKLRDGEVIFVDSFGIESPKTAAAKKMLALLSKEGGFAKLGTKKRNAALVALSAPSEAVQKSFRNIGSVQAVDVRNLNPVSVLSHSFVVIENPDAALAVFSLRGKKAHSSKTARS